jgi:hypothetical protein
LNDKDECISVFPLSKKTRTTGIVYKKGFTNRLVHCQWFAQFLKN